MKFKLLISSFVLSVALSSTGLAIAGNDPISGIDIIIKESALCHPHCARVAPVVAPAVGGGKVADQKSSLVSDEKTSGNIQDKPRPVRGNDPITGVDIIIKESALCHPNCK